MTDNGMSDQIGEDDRDKAADRVSADDPHKTAKLARHGRDVDPDAGSD